MTIYGIKTCGSVKKAMKFFKDRDIEYDFFDFKKEQVSSEKIDYWLTQVELKKLFNKQGTKYRTLKLKELNLDDDGLKEWLSKENMLIKRPVIEYGDIDNPKVIVAFDEEVYKEIFGN
jgi:Spx/MgsR family transcriptional regulator